MWSLSLHTLAPYVVPLAVIAVVSLVFFRRIWRTDPSLQDLVEERVPTDLLVRHVLTQPRYQPFRNALNEYGATFATPPAAQPNLVASAEQKEESESEAETEEKEEAARALLPRSASSRHSPGVLFADIGARAADDVAADMVVMWPALASLDGLSWVRSAAFAEPTASSSTSSSFSSSAAKRESVQTLESRVMVRGLRPALHTLLELAVLRARLEVIRSESYSGDDPAHRALLAELWRRAWPLAASAAPDPRGDDAWERLGFQGKKPGTDIRGGGLLALHNLVDFATRFGPLCQRIVKKSHDEGIHWFPFAITGIHLTRTALELTQSGAIVSHYVRHGATYSSFLDLYATLFARLHAHWGRQPPGITQMEFPRLLKETVEQLVDFDHASARGFEPVPPAAAGGASRVVAPPADTSTVEQTRTR